MRHVSLGRAAGALFGASVIFATSFCVAYPLWWKSRALTAGAALLTRAHVGIPSSPALSPNQCVGNHASTAPASKQPGVLEIPSIGLVAPVLQGLSDEVLNVAVGHEPSTPWPGSAGESVVLAHDVSYFAGLSRVANGAKIIWLTGCVKATFVVDKAVVTSPGKLLYPPSNNVGIALVTCYPTDSLFWTPQRYVVTAHLLGSVVANDALPNAPGLQLPEMSVDAPAPLVAQGLDLSKNSLELGTLSLSGTPLANFAQGPEPLAIERDALEVFFGAQKSVLEHQSSWWDDLAAPGLPFPTTWPEFSRVDVDITMKDATPTSVQFISSEATATIALRDGTWQLAALGGPATT